MEAIMLMNVVEPEETRVAIVEDGALEELYVERTEREQIVGNVYKGIVVNVEQSIDAAFVDFGFERHGFLHVSDVKLSLSSGGRRGAKEGRAIKDILSVGRDILVQVTREGIGGKGPALTTYLSIPGRYMVLMPGLSRRGVSRKITDETERRRLRQLLDEVKPPKDFGFIVRTAGEGKSKPELARDVDYLVRLWGAVSSRADKSKPPAMVYRERDQVIRVIRDVFNEEIREIIVDSKEVCSQVKEFLRMVMPHHVRKVKLYDDDEPLFHKYGIDEELEKMYRRTVALRGGGSIVLEQTEALVAIDVNSGRYKKQKDAEQTAFRTNLQAAGEIARQVRLRNLGGLLIIDFIDMENEKQRTEVEKALWQALQRDRARQRMLKMSPFCVVEMTRQRRHVSVDQAAHMDCPVCHGTGRLKTPETMALEVIRELRVALGRRDVHQVEAVVAPDVANRLSNIMRSRLQGLEVSSGKVVRVTADAALMTSQSRMRLLNESGKDIKQ